MHAFANECAESSCTAVVQPWLQTVGLALRVMTIIVIEVMVITIIMIRRETI